MALIQDRLKKIKYRCQTLGIKELDVIFSKIYQNLSNTHDIETLSLLEDLLEKETQYIFDIFFNEISQFEKEKYQKIIDLSK
jgi:succinate dehydrogenase flavin-adding protein (antitoxin of CptAB toxin-antitoxin module)